MEKFRTVIFDLDGVILDSIELTRIAFETSYREVVGTGDPPFDEYKKHLGKSLPKILNIMGLPKEMYDIFIKESYRQANRVNYFGDIPNVLEYLSDNSINIGIATGKDGERARWFLSRLNLLDFFNLVVGSDEVSNPKPAPDMIWKHLEYFQTKTSQTLMIGDSVTDLRAGRNASVHVAAALWGDGGPSELIAENPDFILHNPLDILNLWGF